MKKILLFISLFFLPLIIFAQVTNQNSEIRRAGARYWANGTGGEIRLYNARLVEGGGNITLTGANWNLSTNSLLGTGSIGATGSRILKIWTADLEITNLPTVAGVSIFTNPTIVNPTVTTNLTTDALTLGGSTVTTFQELTDVAIPAVATGTVGNVLTDNGIAWVSSPPVGTSFSTLKFVSDTTIGAPEAGDSVLINTGFVNKHLDVWREGSYQYPITTEQNVTAGITFNSVTGELIFRPAFATNEHVVINASNSSTWSDITLQAPLLTNLMGYWKLDEVSGTTSVNTVGSGDGTIVGGGVNALGKTGRAVQFDGVGEKVAVPITNVLPAGDKFTISVAVKFDSLGTQSAHNVIVCYKAESSLGHILRATANGAIYFNTYNTSDALFEATTADARVTTGSWYHIVAVCQGAGLPSIIYINNVVRTNYVSGNFSGTLRQSTGELNFGNGYFDVTELQGTIDEVKIWDRALTPAEVAIDYGYFVAGTPIE